MERQRLLIISLSPIRNDARVLKQIRHFAQEYNVTTCGYGPSTDEVPDHIEVSVHPAITRLGMEGLMRVGQVLPAAHIPSYWMHSTVQEAYNKLKRREFDVILADDLDTIPLAVRLKPRGGVHGDLHEYWPLMHEESKAWMRRRSPWFTTLCRSYLPKCASLTTVSQGLADKYHEEFGVQIGVVTNATPYRDLNPTPVHDPIRIVHSGIAHRERNFKVLIDAVRQSTGYTLDLFLLPPDSDVLQDLRAYSEGDDRIHVNPGVPYSELIDTLNQFDIGVHLLPPLNFNFKNALPNKIFDFAQARLAAIVGPLPEMARYLEEYGYGVVTSGFETDYLRNTLKQLTPELIMEMKRSADAHAHELSAESQIPIWDGYVKALMANARRASNHA